MPFVKTCAELLETADIFFAKMQLDIKESFAGKTKLVDGCGLYQALL